MRGTWISLVHSEISVLRNPRLTIIPHTNYRAVSEHRLHQLTRQSTRRKNPQRSPLPFRKRKICTKITFNCLRQPKVWYSLLFLLFARLLAWLWAWTFCTFVRPGWLCWASTFSTTPPHSRGTTFLCWFGIHVIFRPWYILNSIALALLLRKKRKQIGATIIIKY